MPSLREDQQPDAVIDLRHGSLQRAQTDRLPVGEVVLLDDGLPTLPPAPVFAHEPVVLDTPGATRKKRRVAELEEIVAANARAALEAREIALEQRRQLEAATDAWRATAVDLAELRRDLKGFAAARADLIAKERERAEQAARTQVEAELQHQEAARVELQAEIDRLRATVAEHQASTADHTQRLRDEQRQRAEAEKEAKRAIAAYETAERRLETAGEALHRHATDEQARIEAAEAARDAAEAELAALGGGGQVAKLTSRVEDLVQQLGELDAELAAADERADRAEVAATAAAARAEEWVAELEAALATARDDADTRVAAALASGRDDADRRVADVEAALRTARDDADARVARLEVALADSRGEAATQIAGIEATLAAARDDADTRVAGIEATLQAARDDADDAKDRATVARVRLDELGTERDALLATIAGLEQAAVARERGIADELARAEATLELADTTDLEAELVAARFDAEALRGETAALAAQLEDAWAQVEEARRIAASAQQHRTSEPDTDTDAGPDDRHDSVDAVSTATGESLLDAFADLAAPPEVGAELGDGGDESVDRPVERPRMAPPPPDPEDPDARRAALGFLNSLAKDVPGSRTPGR